MESLHNGTKQGPPDCKVNLLPYAVSQRNNNRLRRRLVVLCAVLLLGGIVVEVSLHPRVTEINTICLDCRSIVPGVGMQMSSDRTIVLYLRDDLTRLDHGDSVHGRSDCSHRGAKVISDADVLVVQAAGAIARRYRSGINAASDGEMKSGIVGQKHSIDDDIHRSIPTQPAPKSVRPNGAMTRPTGRRR